MIKKINSPSKLLILTVFFVLYLVHSNISLFAFGIDLNNINIHKLQDKTQIVLDLSKIPKDYSLDTSNPDEVKITLKETYLSTDLIKNLDIILNDNIKWKQYSDKLDITFKHTNDSSAARTFKMKNKKELVIEVPSTVVATNTIPDNPTNIKPLPPKKSSANVSRSISSFRDRLPQYVVTSRSNPNNQINYKQIFPGVTHIVIKRITSSGPLFINVLDIAPKNPSLEVLPALANERIHGKKTVRTILNENNGLAGINAGFFKPPTGVPLGTMIIDDELISGPIFDRVTLGITRDEEYKIERIHLTGQLANENGDLITLDNVNQPRLSCNQYLLYSYKWGWKTPPTETITKHVLLVKGKIRAISSDPMAIPKNGYVIAGPDKGAFSNLRVGDKVKLIVTTDPDWSDVKHAIGGGPFLVKNNQIYVDIDAQKFSLKNVRAPRTAVGVTKDDHLLLVTVDGRQKDLSIGVTFYELAALMIELGAVNAMNLDGGSSTQMCIKDQVVNSPTVSGGNNVSNGLIVIPKTNIR